MELAYSIVDVFTKTALAGNPLAVVMNTASLAGGSAQEQSGRITEVRVAGSTVLVARGQLFLP